VTGSQSILIQLLEDEFGEGEQDFSVMLRLEGQSEAVLLGDHTARVTISGPGTARWEGHVAESRGGKRRSRSPEQRQSFRGAGSRESRFSERVESKVPETSAKEESEGGRGSPSGFFGPMFAMKSGNVWKQKVNERREEKGLPPLEFSKRMKIPVAWEQFIDEGATEASPKGEEGSPPTTATSASSTGTDSLKSSVNEGGRRGSSRGSRKLEMLDAMEAQHVAESLKAVGGGSPRAELVLKGAKRGKDLSTYVVNNARVMTTKKLRALVGSIFRAKQAANGVRRHVSPPGLQGPI
jgi:hypothetical protein